MVGNYNIMCKACMKEEIAVWLCYVIHSYTWKIMDKKYWLKAGYGRHQTKEAFLLISNYTPLMGTCWYGIEMIHLENYMNKKSNLTLFWCFKL